MLNKKFFGEIDTKDEKKIEEMERLMFGNEFVDKLKQNKTNIKGTANNKIKNMAV